MGSKSGREMRRLTLSVTVMVMALVVAILAYFLVDVVVTTRRNIRENRELVVRKTAEQMKALGTSFKDPAVVGKFAQLFDPSLIKDVLERRDFAKVVEIALMFTQSLAPAMYTGVLLDGKVVSVTGQPDVQVGEGFHRSVPEEGYVLLEEFSGRKGYFVAVNYKVDLGFLQMGNLNIISVTDKTSEIKEIDDFFTRQRNSTLLRLAIAAVLALLVAFFITTTGLRHFTRRYITRPVEELNRMAEEIASGTFQGEVVVDKGSSFAALQGLLRSGQLVISKMEKELR